MPAKYLPMVRSIRMRSVCAGQKQSGRVKTYKENIIIKWGITVS